MFDFLKKKEITEHKNNIFSDLAKTHLEAKFVEVYNHVLNLYPELYDWLEARRWHFLDLLMRYENGYIYENSIEEYIKCVINESEKANELTIKNIDDFTKFCKDISPNFIVTGKIPGIVFPNFPSDIPSLFYATGFESVDYDKHGKTKTLKFYGLSGNDNSFKCHYITSSYDFIRNMDKDEFVRFLSLKIQSTPLQPWEFDNFKEKWNDLYHKTNILEPLNKYFNKQ